MLSLAKLRYSGQMDIARCDGKRLSHGIATRDATVVDQSGGNRVYSRRSWLHTGERRLCLDVGMVGSAKSLLNDFRFDLMSQPKHM